MSKPNLNDIRSVILPMIRNVMPSTIAQDIIGVQPMTASLDIKMKIGIERMQHPDYNIDGREYYWVTPAQKDGFLFSTPAKLEESRAYYKEIENWCINSFGPAVDWSNNDRRWFASNRKYYFRDESDRLLFILRWE